MLSKAIRDVLQIRGTSIGLVVFPATQPRVLGKGYKTDLDLVFATVDGNYLRPDSVTAAVCLLGQNLAFWASASIPYVTATGC